MGLEARRAAARIVVALIAAGAVFLLSGTRLHRFIERRSLDYRFVLRDTLEEPAPSAPVVIVGIDRKTVDRYPGPVALNEAMTVAIDAATAGGATAIGFDVIHLMAVDDAKCDYKKGVFFESIAKSQRMIVPYSLQKMRGEKEAGVAIPTYVKDFMAAAMGIDAAAVSRFPQTAKFKLLDAAQSMMPVRFGYANLDLDEGGAARELRLAMDSDGQLLPSFALAVYLKHAGLKPSDVKLTDDELTAGAARVPLEDGKMIINYAAPSGGYPMAPMADVIDRREDGQWLKQTFEGKIALIGSYDLRFPDFHATPYSAAKIGRMRSMFGVEIVANALDTLIGGRFVRRPPAWVATAGVLAACVVAVLLLTPLPLWASLPLLLALMGGQFAFAQFMFSRHDLWLDLASVEIALPFAFLLGHLHNTFVLDRDKRFIQRVLGSYLDPSIVKEVAKKGDVGLLKGRRRECTVLFSDVRGFTTMSEMLQPEQVVEILNIHLSIMSGIILASGGMVDKYVGDAIMAIWNAPNEVEDHRLRACEAALKMQAAMAEVNRQIEAKGIALKTPLKVGIGINTGHAVVGNIGSEQKSDYTAIGDAVNVAARLESQTKAAGVDILISDSVKDGLNGALAVKDLGSVEVKGRAEAVRIFELESIKA